MSAIAAILNLNGCPVEPDELNTVLNSLSHRGGDGRGTWAEGEAGLGHVMHRITPESLKENLPASNKNACVITCDARIDNRVDLISKLSLSNYSKNEITDSQIILEAYEKWGEDCLPKLIGDFVFAIWNAKEKRLFCARDPLGVKHFYYYYVPGKIFALASEIKALLRIKGVHGELNEEFLGDFLIGNLENKENTFYKNIQRLPATHSLTVSLKGLRIKNYWTPEIREIKYKKDSDYHEAFREVFTEAVVCRLRSAYPVAASLSGGLDSSGVVCVASKYLKEKNLPALTAYSGIFPSTAEIDPRIEERKFIRSVVEKTGCRNEQLVVDESDPLRHADKLIWHADHPIGHLNLYMTTEILKRAEKDQIRVLLSGHDGDSTVSYGYEDFEQLARRGRFVRLVSEAVALKKNMPIPRQHDFKQLVWSRGLRPAIPDFVVDSWRHLRGRKSREAENPWLNRKFELSYISSNFNVKQDLEERLAKNYLSNYPENSSRQERHWRYLSGGLFSTMHEQLEKISAGFGIEQRHPFFDRRLIEFCINLPPGQRLYKGWTRSIFRFAMKDIVPDEVRWRTGKANLGSYIKINLFKYGLSEIQKTVFSESWKLDKYIDRKSLEAAYHSCAESPQRKDREILFLLTSIYLLKWLNMSGFVDQQT